MSTDHSHASHASPDGDYSVLMVCMGNICRSPTAEGVFRSRVQAAGLAHRIGVDSAGTHDYHPGAAPDRRSQHHALRRGYDLSDLRARQLRPGDFVIHDLVLVMDEGNQAAALRQCPAGQAHKLRLFSSFSSHPARRGRPVPDPYGGGPADFERVLDLVEEACDGLLRHVQAALAERDRPRDR